jgi:DNA-binding NtrC family response regulator
MQKPDNHLISKMLVTEDDPVLKRFYQQALENICKELSVVESPVEAMRLLKSKKFDFLITDLKLTGKDGLDIISCAVENCPEIIILVASGYVTDSKYHDELVHVGNIKGFLQKPFTVEILHQKLESIVSDACNPPT